MVKLSRILVPVEFSPRVHGAVQYAEALPSRFPSEIVLLHVIVAPMSRFSELAAMTYSNASDLVRELLVLRSEDLEQFPCKASEAGGVRRVVLEGDPARVITEY